LFTGILIPLFTKYFDFDRKLGFFRIDCEIQILILQVYDEFLRLTNGRLILVTLKDGLIECEALKTIATVADKGSLAGVRVAVTSSRSRDERRC